MSRSTAERLWDARSFAHDGEYRVLGLDGDTFADAVEVKYTVYYCLIGLGEALKGIPARNRLVHSYWRIDDDIVYRVATVELPALSTALERMIKRHGESAH